MPKPKIYSSNAEKQKAYRLRKKLNGNTKQVKSNESNVTKVTKSNTVTKEKVTQIKDKNTEFDLKKYKNTMNDLLGMNDPGVISSKKAIELPLILLTEVLDDIRSRKVKGFNLSSKKWNDKPYREMFETTLRLLKEKIK